MGKPGVGQTLPGCRSSQYPLMELCSADPSKGLHIIVLVCPGSFQSESPSARGGCQSNRDQEQSVRYRLNCLLHLPLVQHLHLEEFHEAVSEHQGLKPAAGYLAQTCFSLTLPKPNAHKHPSIPLRGKKQASSMTKVRERELNARLVKFQSGDQPCRMPQGVAYFAAREPI